LFEPVTPPEGVASESLPEAASMLGIRLSSRESASHALKNTYPEEKDRPTSAPVAVLPLPDKKSMVVIDNPDAREEPGRSGKSRRIIAALAILAAVLAGAYYFVAKDTQFTRSIITKSVTISLPPTDVSAKASSPVIPVVPETLVTTDEPMVKSPKKPVATTPKPTGRYSVQLGSLPNSRDAQRELKSLRQRHGGILSSLDLRVVPGTVPGSTAR
jgi:cell division septation protein DedD